MKTKGFIQGKKGKRDERIIDDLAYPVDKGKTRFSAIKLH